MVGVLALPGLGFAKNLQAQIAADALEVKSVGLLPTSPLYFLKEASRSIQSFFTFNPVKKAELKLKIADEKLMETKAVSEQKPNDEKALAKALENYELQTDELKTRLEALKISSENPNVQRLFEKVTDRVAKHQQFLETLPLDKEIKENLPKEQLTSNSEIQPLGTEVQENSASKVLLMPDATSNTKDVKVLSPNGGETWPLEYQKLIKWGGPSSISDGYEIALLSSDKTKNWKIGRYGVSTFWGGIATLWTVGNYVSCSQSVCEKIQPGEYYIKITNLKSGASDESDESFKISPAQKRTISVISPNGGETLKIGETLDISWTTSVDAELLVKLAPVNSQGTPDITKPRHNIRARLSGAGVIEKYQWKIPNTIQPGKYLMEVSRYCCGEGVRGVDYDYSDTPFSIVPPTDSSQTSSIKVLSPNGGETWQIGKTHKIKWNSSKDISKIFINLMAHNGRSYVDVCGLVGSKEASNNVYEFTLTETSCGNLAPSDHLLFKVKPGEYKVAIMGDGEGNYVPFKARDESDAPFKIIASTLSQEPKFQVLWPNGGGTLKIGQTYEIEWNPGSYPPDTRVGISLDDTRYDYFSESPLGSVGIVSTQNTGNYSWKVPAELVDGLGRVMKLGSGNVYKISVAVSRIGGECISGKCDYSDANFSIVPDDGVRG